MELVFLHGTAASGKLTTARALESLLGYPVFHNHLVVDALTAVFPFGSEPFVRLREEIWLQVFTAAARTGRSLTFTFAPEATVRVGFPSRARALVEAGGGRVYFVRLIVSEREQELRIGSQSRKQFHKLTDLNTLRELRNYRDDVEQPPVDLEVDSDTSSAEDTAALIAERFQLTPQERRERYPQRGEG
jgi:chloramphenicol 3-O-phosphotransferase